MKLTTYKSRIMTNENGRVYRVFHFRFWKFELGFTFTRLIGTGKTGIQSAVSPQIYDNK